MSVCWKESRTTKKKENPELDTIFLHCINHQEALCKTVLQLDHVVKQVIKIVIFIRAKGLRLSLSIRFIPGGKWCRAPRLTLLLQYPLVKFWESGSFLELKGKANDFPKLKDAHWLCDLHSVWTYWHAWMSWTTSYKVIINLCMKCIQTWKPSRSNHKLQANNSHISPC